MTSVRNVNLDLMRLLGVLLIMIAHASPPEWLSQLRNFATPLLIVASGLTYAAIYGGRTLEPIPFYKRRLSRLIIPPWLFLTFFFSIIYISSELSNEPYPFPLTEIVSSYLFYKGIGFVWIFKVYIILALITPFALKISTMRVSNSQYFSVLLCLYAAYELLIRTTSGLIPADLLEFFNAVIFLLAPYSLLYLYGMRLGSLSNRTVVVISLMSLLAFIVMVGVEYLEFGDFIPTQNFKYPPTFYYLTYAFFGLNLVYLICKNLTLSAPRPVAIITWLSANSMSIYLWHIMAYFMWRYSLGPALDIVDAFPLMVCFLLGFGVAVTYLQTLVVNAFASWRYSGARP